MIFLSHREPDMELQSHLKEVALLSKGMIEETPIPVEERCFLSSLSAIIGIAHDFGKYTTYFQKYIKDEEKSGTLHHHSFISAFFAFYLLDRFIKEKEGWKKYIPLIGYFVVMHHHGNLRSIHRDIIFYGDYQAGRIDTNLRDRLDTLKIQIVDLKKQVDAIEEQYRDMADQLQIPLDFPLVSAFLDDWERCLENLDRLHYVWDRKEKDEHLKHRVYQYTLFLYSALIDADKHSAARINRSPRRNLPPELVDNWREENFNLIETDVVNRMRNRIYQTVMERMEEVRKALTESHIFTLTAPTGAGKTLLSFSVALKWRNILQEKWGFIPRIIYGLPFTSIIDQNEKVIRNVLMQLADFSKNEHNYLLKHHHLSDVKYRQDDQELPVHESLLMMESWEAEVVVTTFIQLFYTLIGYKNRTLKKFHHIAGSIIILDEVQSLPMEYWPLVRWTLQGLSEHLRCKIFLLTATQPLIFNPEQTTELLQKNSTVTPQTFFQDMNRVTMQYITNEGQGFNVEDWISHFVGKFQDGKNYLAVFNTIKTSIEVYREIKAYVEERELEHQVLYLSTNIIPRERRTRIRKVKKLLKQGKKVILISTQVVEAGVDLDFDIVYRDLGPIDCIIQVAGRCNRNGHPGKVGEVYVTPIVRGNRLESSLIYGALHTDMAKKLLPEHPVPENKFFELVHDFFSGVLQRKNTDASNEIWKAMNMLYFDRAEDKDQIAVSDFRLIENKSRYVDVFVEADSFAKVLWKTYQQRVLNCKDHRAKYESYLRLRKYLRQYIVSAPIHLVKGLHDVEPDSDVYLLPNDLVSQYYDREVGIIRSAEEVETWIM